MRLVRQEILIAFTALMMLCSNTSHATLVFTNNVLANFTFTPVVGNLLGLPVDPLHFVATGAMTFSLDDSVANASTMAFTNATGFLTVVSPFPDATMGPHQFVGGQLRNITRDAQGNITGGNISDLRMRWQMSVPGVGRLYTADSLPFNGAITGAPFQVGNAIAGPAPFDVFLDLGLGNPGQPGGDPLTVIGTNRVLTISAVPEPSSLALLAAGLSYALVGVARKCGAPGSTRNFRTKQME